MSVTTTHAYKVYNGNGSTTDFPIDFQFFTSAELVVTAIDAAGAETVLTISTHYTVSGGGAVNPATGTLTMLVAPAAGTKLRIDRATLLTQDTVHSNNDSFPAKTVEGAYDRRTLLEQDNRLLAQRSLKLPMQDYAAGSGGYDAGGFRVEDMGEGVNSGDAVTLGQMTSAISAAALSASVGDFAQEGVGAVGRSYALKLRERFCPKDFGAIGDGTHHPLSERYASLATAQAVYPFVTSLTHGIDYAAWQACINAAITLGHRTADVTKGIYTFNGTDPALDPGTGVSMIGQSRGGCRMRVTEADGGTPKLLFYNVDGGDKEELSIQHMTIEGTLFDGVAQHGTWLGLMQFYPVVSVVNVGFRNISCIGFIFQNCDAVTYDRVRATDIARCPVRVTNARKINLHSLLLERTGDDPISVHVGNSSLASASPAIGEDILIDKVQLVACNGAIKSLGGRRVSVTNVHGILSAGIIIGDTGESTEGGQQPFAVRLKNIEMADCTRFQTGGAIAQAIAVYAAEARGSTATHSTIPGLWDSTASAFIEYWNHRDGVRTESGDALNPMIAIQAEGITVHRTLPDAADVSDYGYGTPNVAGAYVVQAMDETNLRPDIGVNFDGFCVGLEMTNFYIANAGVGLQFRHWKHSKSLRFGRGAIRDTPTASVSVAGQPVSQETLNAIFDGVTFDADPFRRNANSNTDGTYDVNGTPTAISCGANVAGMQILNSQFWNCCRITNATTTLHYWSANKAFLGTPTALGFNAANKGIGNVPNIPGVDICIIDADPTSATYEQSAQQLLKTSAAMPSAGWYPVGWFTAKTTPDAVVGWRRITSGTGHVLNTDWVAQGRVQGPSSATDNALARFDATTGQLLQNSLMTVDDTGNANIPTGQSYGVAGSAVVKDRKTGWTAATGTAQRSGFATYTSPDISASPTESEVQAIADGLQNVSRTLKALIDDLHQTAGHGLIGT